VLSSIDTNQACHTRVLMLQGIFVTGVAPAGVRGNRRGGFAIAALLLVVAPGAVAGCTSSPKSAACENSQCAPGNTCIDDHSGTGSICHRICTRQDDCPSGWYCNDGTPLSWCALSTTKVSPAAGQFGTPCAPSDGEANNKACDAVDGLSCYGTSRADANAFCTLFGCAMDTDCPGGWWCEVVDVAPNVTTTVRSFGPTRTACLPRQYCATCQADHDCSPSADGTEQHCAPDANGKGFCAPECASNAACPLDATCVGAFDVCTPTACMADSNCPLLGATAERCLAGSCKVACTTDASCPPINGGPAHCGPAGSCEAPACASDDDCPPTAGTFQHCLAGTCTPECGGPSDCRADQKCGLLSVCHPRAGVCLGDGGFCSPCRSDADCQDGYCLSAPNSTERFCSQTAQGSCAGDAATTGTCPARPNGAKYMGVACTTEADSFAPANQCVGYVVLGTSTGAQEETPGCYTINR
jgi:hypothetical protein